jgi:hypothetical protein
MSGTNEDIKKARYEGKESRTSPIKKANRYYNKELEKGIAKFYKRYFENFGGKKLGISEVEQQNSKINKSYDQKSAE